MQFGNSRVSHGRNNDHDRPTGNHTPVASKVQQVCLGSLRTPFTWRVPQWRDYNHGILIYPQVSIYWLSVKPTPRTRSYIYILVHSNHPSSNSSTYLSGKNSPLRRGEIYLKSLPFCGSQHTSCITQHPCRAQRLYPRYRCQPQHHDTPTRWPTSISSLGSCGSILRRYHSAKEGWV